MLQTPPLAQQGQLQTQMHEQMQALTLQTSLPDATPAPAITEVSVVIDQMVDASGKPIDAQLAGLWKALHG